eukprot:1149644-Pelagomonas_calceolata.AAC.5
MARLVEVSFKNAREIRAQLTDALPEERWRCSKIRIALGHIIDFWNRDIRAVILKLYSSVKHGAGFSYKSKQKRKANLMAQRSGYERKQQLRNSLGTMR